ncbi:hypothetical protein MTR_2g033780 [Medicago truncatula]|uniref:Uncharacterized protein n=1 Tax=Medicago truncatula TaxID=3880 RepID=G7IMS2_MEDTR|nr:hypothetical protein MTR_2g033780 [Medicago truncatula]
MMREEDEENEKSHKRMKEFSFHLQISYEHEPSLHHVPQCNTTSIAGNDLFARLAEKPIHYQPNGILLFPKERLLN